MESLFFFILETVMLVALYKKYSLENAVFIVFMIVYFYCNSIIIDMFFLVGSDTLYQNKIVVRRDSMAFFLTNLSYFLFMATYFFLFMKRVPIKRRNIIIEYKSIKIIVYVIIIITVLMIIRNSNSTRTELKESGGILITTINFFILFFWAFCLLCVSNFKHKKILIYSIITIIYCIFTYEREPIVFVGVLFLIKFHKKINPIYFAVFAVLGVFIISYYKAFYMIILGGYDSNVFFQYVAENKISLSKLDPLASYALLYDYFDTHPFFYYDFGFTYITSFIDQIQKVAFDVQPESMAKTASKYYVGGAYGVAYSMILESIINFSYLGPVFLALCARAIYVFLKRIFYYLNQVIDLIFIMFFLSFIRTELIVMSKIFIFPMVFFILLITFLKNKNKMKNQYKIKEI